MASYKVSQIHSCSASDADHSYKGIILFKTHLGQFFPSCFLVQTSLRLGVSLRNKHEP